jgi:hypothetical protein
MRRSLVDEEGQYAPLKVNIQLVIKIEEVKHQKL